VAAGRYRAFRRTTRGALFDEVIVSQALHGQQQSQCHQQSSRRIVESGVDSHVVHLGTMGVYGYSAARMKIPEGYLPIKLEEDGKVIHREILYPADPGASII